jgi:hypothetical protein
MRLNHSYKGGLIPQNTPFTPSGIRRHDRLGKFLLLMMILVTVFLTAILNNWRVSAETETSSRELAPQATLNMALADFVVAFMDSPTGR